MGSESARWRLGAGIAAILMCVCLMGCASMEQKRDKFMANGQKLFEQGDYTKARLQFKNAIQIDPKYAEAYRWLGKTEFRAQNFRAAYGALNQAVELNPEITEAQVLLGQILLQARRLEEAEAKAKLALKQDPKNIDAMLLAANLAAVQKKPQEALDLLAQVRKADPEKTAVYLMQSAIEANEKRYDAALAALDDGLKVNSKDINLYLAKMRLAMLQKQFDLAEASLQQAIDLEPKNVRLYQQMTLLYVTAKQTDKVEQTLRKILTLEPDKEGHVIALSQFLANQGRVKDGEQTLKDFVGQYPSNYNARFALADYYLSRGREARGEKVLQEIVSLDASGPIGLRGKNALARLYVSRSQLPEAEKLLAEITKDNPRDMEATLTQGLIALGKKDGLQAVSSFRILVNDHPKKPEYWLLMARAHLLHKEPDQAKEKARKAVELKTDFLEARKFLYDLYLQNKDYEGAIQAIRGYLKYNEKDIFNLSALGEVYSLKEDNEQVRATFQKIIDADPKNPQGYYNLGVFSRRQKQPQEAIKYFDQALAQQPNFMPALQQLVDLYREQKQADKALEAVRQVLARSPKNPALHQMLGELLLVSKQPQAAAAEFEEALNLNPRQLAALRLLLTAYRQQLDKDEVNRYLEAKAQDPKQPPFYTLALAMLYEQQQKFDKATAVYENMMARNLFPELARNNLAYGLAEHAGTPENLERALQLVNEALEEFPEDPHLLDTKGWIMCKKGEYARGKTYLEQAAAKNPNHPSFLYHMGWCSEKLGEKDKSREFLEKALASKSDFPEKADSQRLLESLGKQ